MTTEDKLNQLKELINNDAVLLEFLQVTIAESILYSDNYDEDQSCTTAIAAINRVLNSTINK